MLVGDPLGDVVLYRFDHFLFELFKLFQLLSETKIFKVRNI